MARHHRVNPLRGSHLPVLIRALKATTGPVVELGAGIYSTPILHALCEAEGRKLVTYENDPDFFEWASHYQSSFHDVRKVEIWADVDLAEVNWAVAFVDHAPDEKRWQEVVRLTHAEYVVCHDSNRGWRRKYNYEKAYPLFKYQKQYREKHPNTVILSNTHPVEDMW
ncbi:hypothetical protein KKH23_04550 [Patescibacteria group bacterium]|nr:hypothetical protein [Patescibacteria group bacterium]